MGLLDLIVHLLNFVAPALGVGLLLAWFSRLLFKQKSPSASWVGQFVVNAVIGTVVLVLGLVVLGRDGKMLTYIALVLVMAAGQLMQLGDKSD
jgi:hypothetical protein